MDVMNSEYTMNLSYKIYLILNGCVWIYSKKSRKKHRSTSADLPTAHSGSSLLNKCTAVGLLGSFVR